MNKDIKYNSEYENDIFVYSDIYYNLNIGLYSFLFIGCCYSLYSLFS